VTVGQIFDWISKGGALALLVLILIGGWKRIWVWGYQLTDCEKRSDEWKQMALGGYNLASRATQAAERTVDVRAEVLDVLKEQIRGNAPARKRKR
jgi:hypothetical protein